LQFPDPSGGQQVEQPYPPCACQAGKAGAQSDRSGAILLQLPIYLSLAHLAFAGLMSVEVSSGPTQ